jgi:glutamine synthetase
MTKEEAVLSQLRAQDVRYVLAQFVDIHGVAKAKSVPVEHLHMVLGDGAGFAGFALWGFGMGRTTWRWAMPPPRSRCRGCRGMRASSAMAR